MTEKNKIMTERDEIALYQKVKTLLKEEKRTDGEIAYVVRDINKLIEGIKEFYGEIQNKGFGEKKGI